MFKIALFKSSLQLIPDFWLFLEVMIMSTDSMYYIGFKTLRNEKKTQ